ncbi:hypothetical protein BDW68DRAFT_100123 [Aspergillus falconensis]
MSTRDDTATCTTFYPPRFLRSTSLSSGQDSKWRRLSKFVGGSTSERIKERIKPALFTVGTLGYKDVTLVRCTFRIVSVVKPSPFTESDGTLAAANLVPQPLRTEFPLAPLFPCPEQMRGC